jgi:hypothetical protein
MAHSTPIIVVENGTGIATANSYATLAEADTYYDERHNVTWQSSSTSARTVALIKATDYIDYTYSFKGTPSGTTQALQWPRTRATDINLIVIDSDVIPVELKRAVFELALRSLSEDIDPDLTTSSQLQSETRKVDVISRSFSYTAGVQVKRFTQVQKLLRGLTSGSSFTKTAVL